MKKMLLITVLFSVPAFANTSNTAYLNGVYAKCYKIVRDEMGFRSVKAVHRAIGRERSGGQVLATHSACVRSNY